MATHFNITGELTQELIAAGGNARISEISLANTDASHLGIVDLYIEKQLTGKFYIMKGVKIPAGAALSHSFTINNLSGEFGLYIKLTKTTTFTLTGSIDPIADQTVTGVGTLFLTEVSVGDEIVVSGETRIVESIASNTELEVTVAFSNNSNDATPDCNPVAPIDVIIS